MQNETDPPPADKASLKELLAQLADQIGSCKGNERQAQIDFSGEPDADDQLPNTAQSDEISRHLSPGEALVYTIVGDVNVTEIVVTASNVVARRSPTETTQQLYDDVTRYRFALSHPDFDPVPLGKKFYSLIFAPIQADLEGAHATTVMFSLDDALRYIPVAALVDPAGDYVVQHFKTETVSLFGGEPLPSGAPGAPKVLGLGTSRAHTVGHDDFPALPGVAEELSEIVREPGETTGVVPGLRLVDDQFTLTTMDQSLASHEFNMVHIASHFAIGTSDTSSSLLLGDGTTETVANLRSVPNRFAGTDLLTLSACDTNEDIRAHDGHEVEGFGTLMQQMGAKNVIASLWPVSDKVTPGFMKALYEYCAQNPQAPIADGLRAAQLSLLDGTSHTAVAVDTPRGPITRSVAVVNESNSLPTFQANPVAPYTHPFYWAPFVLIGSWR